MTATQPLLPYTYDDYCSLPEDMFRRYELLHGDFYMVPAPTTVHQIISSNLNSLLRQWVKEHRLGKLLYSPVDVILGIGDAREVVQPDLVYVASERHEIVKLHGIEGPPDLVVEILSPGTVERDRGYKLKMYARYRVREYWIVDPETRSAALYAFGTQQNIEPKFYTTTDVMTSALFPGLTIPLAEVFAD